MATRASRWWMMLGLAALVGCDGMSVLGGDAGSPPVDDRVALDAPDDIATPDVVAPPDVVAAPDAVTAPDAGPDVVDAGPPRCATNADCPGRACDVATGLCVTCVASADTCPASQHCDDVTHACVSGCRADEGCAAATTGDAGAALPQRCDLDRHECVACVRDEHCPPGNLCVGNACVVGCNAAHPCATGLTCCDGACVDTDGNASHCGACGARCALPGAAPGCNNGHCVVSSCSDGLGDCDRDPSNGCEVDTRTAVSHCGGCGMACAPRDHATASCAASRCAYTCNAGYADCDGDPSNGCEVDTRATAAHCGACGAACPARPSTLSACVAGGCVYACTLGAGDCNGNASDGCEVDLASSELHCGACGRTCVTANVASARCATSRCMVVACSAGFADCDGDPSNGCEVDTRASNAHCGACGSACAAGTACSGSTCRSTCAAGETFCAGRCVDTRTAVTDCGGCGTVCPTRAHAAATCAAGSCGYRCDAGFGDCDGSAANGCEVDTTTSTSSCGACMRACTAPAGATATCSGAACGFACNTGFSDCNTSAADGCEVDTQTNASHCGACNARCTLAGTTASRCEAGTCRVDTCATGRGDCDGAPSNGCEVDLTSASTNCGACGRACATGQSCQAGVCTAFPSTGSDGVFDPAGNTVLPSGVYNFQSIRVRAGVTVTTSGEGVLDLRSQGAIDIAGTIDLSGGRGGDGTVCNGAASGGGTTGAPTAGISNDLRPDNSGSPGGGGGRSPAGANGQNATMACQGTGGSFGGGGGGGWPTSGGIPGCGSGGGGGAAGGGGGGGGMCCSPSSYGGRALYAGGTGGGPGGGPGGAPSAPGNGGQGGGAPYDGSTGSPAGCGGDGEGGGGGGSIGATAAADLAMSATFQPGSGGGAGGGGHGMGGGGGGGALRLATTTTLTVTGRLLANGGRGGDGTSGCCGAGGGGGSGGAIMLVAPTLTVSSAATVSAVGGVGGVASAPYGGAGGAGGLGRVTLQARAASCSLAGAFNPPLVSACAASTGSGTRGRAYVSILP